jgi:hypothetical protein
MQFNKEAVDGEVGGNAASYAGGEGIAPRLPHCKLVEEVLPALPGQEQMRAGEKKMAMRRKKIGSCKSSEAVCWAARFRLWNEKELENLESGSAHAEEQQGWLLKKKG